MFRAQQIMQEEGITIQPYWRSIFNAQKTGLRAARSMSARSSTRALYWEA
jgi:hypothetical protein